MLEKIIKFRKQLHKHPELSGNERETAKFIEEFVRSNHDTCIITELGGQGLAVVYDLPEEGPSVMIRCELDALPIEEVNEFSHKSKKPGISHKCGHDGHMAIVAGLILKIREKAFNKGKIILLFQPAEETGEGAYKVLNDPKFRELAPDYVFALHNIPGFPVNSIISVQNIFSSTVQSLAIYLTGKQSHASEPENGINPAVSIAEIVKRFNDLNQPDIDKPSFTLFTPVYINLGSKDYGISAGKGEIHFTIRTSTEEVMDSLKEKLIEITGEIVEKHGLQLNIDWCDYFPASRNDEECNNLILRASKEHNYELIQQQHPFRFGEDFGWFSKRTKAAMFGLGAGTNSPSLHHSDYDFPDEIIETGINMFSSIIEMILNKEELIR
ncbi:amidohydrolase [Gramella jeungdoensis]|uniref:Amidohydrolase n=1 Tax=Gramella jeungdoensis TaxID=708091 RepID=A0ABT0Z301_9FLAO|nr:amidohydrolase [Gramella jeungdoensis]MCM8570116.1 amidohydrolase [Gramella jeungdoensis]